MTGNEIPPRCRRPRRGSSETIYSLIVAPFTMQIFSQHAFKGVTPSSNGKSKFPAWCMQYAQNNETWGNRAFVCDSALEK